jgi:hypothetical protein
MGCQVLCGDCMEILPRITQKINLSFIICPPFNQQKEYAPHDNDMTGERNYKLSLFEAAR